jgi:hypothetical protein
MTTLTRKSRMLATKSCIANRLKCSLMPALAPLLVLNGCTIQNKMTTRPPVHTPSKYGNASWFWVGSPSELVDLMRTLTSPPTGRRRPQILASLSRPARRSTCRWPMRINAAASTYKRMCNGTPKAVGSWQVSNGFRRATIPSVYTSGSSGNERLHSLPGHPGPRHGPRPR